MFDQQILYPAVVARKQLGISNTKFYELLGASRLKAVKVGAATMVTAESLRAFVASLPAAKIQPSKQKIAT